MLDSIVDDESKEISNSKIIRVNPLQLMNAIHIEETISMRMFAFFIGGGLLELQSLNTDIGWYVVAPYTHATHNGKCMREAYLDNAAKVQDNDVLKQMQSRSGAMTNCRIVWAVNKEIQS